MGSCYNCQTQVTLLEEETRCSSCNKILRYWCNSCKKPFDIEDEFTSKKLGGCKTCGFFYCPDCNACGPDCMKKEWANKIKEILGNHFYSTLNGTEILKKIVDYIEDIKSNRDRKSYPKGVPITYAKNRIKGILVRMEGFRVKNNLDQKEFELKLNTIIELPLGRQITISDIRQDGSYGQEYRDSINLAICLGNYKVTYKKNQDDKEYAVYERIDGNKCNNLDTSNLIINKCTKCGRHFERDIERCDCGYYKKGEEEGKAYKTKQTISVKDTCQLYRGSFNNDTKTTARQKL